MSVPEKQAAQTCALDRLVNREEVLQICYWFQGEGFGEVFDSGALQPFLNSDQSAINATFDELVQQGDLECVDNSDRKFQFSAAGSKKGGRLFADSFAEFQNAGHGECAAGCCDGDDHSQCGDHCSIN